MTKIICTVGPTSLNDHVVDEFVRLGVDLLRLNLSHIEVEKLPTMIEYLRDRTNTPICLDSDGELDRPVPSLSDRDIESLAIGRHYGIRYAALSFARNADGVQEIRDLCVPGANIIAKVECVDGITNLDEIASHSDALLIDRGDLSREVPTERVPVFQKRVIGVARTWHCPVYVATNLMESMIWEPEPTIAEANDVFNTLLDGAAGLVLAGETAIGKHPVECVKMVKRLIDVYESEATPKFEMELPRSIALVVAA